MAFCPICGTHHDPNIACFDKAGEMLKEIGIKRHSKMSKEEFKKLEDRADRYMLKVLFIVMAGFLLLLAAIFIAHRYIKL